MKKKALAVIAVALPLTLLCACGGSAVLPLNANWFRFSDASDNLSGKSEQLRYEVTFESNGTSDYAVNYNTGAYTTSLTVEQIELQDGTSETGYHLHSELAISGSFTYKGQTGETFEDSVVSDVYFRNLSARLQPVRSVKTVHTTSPLSEPKAGQVAIVYDYVYTVEYDTPVSKAALSYAQTLPSEDSWEKEVPIGDNSVYYDNEQLLFVLRGLSMDSAVSLQSVNPLDTKLTTVSMVSTPTAVKLSDFEFTMNGEAVKESLQAYTLSFGYNSSFGGQPQTLTYAANTSKEVGENLYRNVLLKMSYTVLQNMGTFTYTLVSADFTE